MGLKSFWQKHKGKILGGLAATAAIGAGAYLIHKHQNQIKNSIVSTGLKHFPNQTMQAVYYAKPELKEAVQDKIDSVSNALTYKPQPFNQEQHALDKRIDEIDRNARKQEIQTNNLNTQNSFTQKIQDWNNWTREKGLQAQEAKSSLKSARKIYDIPDYIHKYNPTGYDKEYVDKSIGDQLGIDQAQAKKLNQIILTKHQPSGRIKLNVLSQEQNKEIENANMKRQFPQMFNTINMPAQGDKDRYKKYLDFNHQN